MSPKNQAAPPQPARADTAAQNRAALDRLPFDDRRDFEDCERGFLGSIPDAEIVGEGGRLVWSQKPYGFLSAPEAPDSVNPSLWRLAGLNTRHGLFEVVPGVYQVRGLDLANMTLVEGDAGVIVVDCLTSVESARAALALYRAHRGARPVSALIYTHTHVDHFGGARGVIEEGASVPVLAPEGFMEHAVSENVIAGPAMLRRAAYQFGPMLAPGPLGQVDAGLGKTTARGQVSLIAPNDHIAYTGETRVYDGVELVFQMAPNSEAPAEMHIFAPRYACLNMAENSTHLFHNLLPFRGAEVRDPLAWSKYIGEALRLFAPRADVLVGQHHWPVWGRERLTDYLKQQRDLYKFTHDQTVRLMNHGLTAPEIAETVRLPPSLARCWQNRDYYGALKHNVRAIYQKYLGWYDANPAHLDPLPPVERARKTVEYMGGAQAVLEKARRDFEAGRYRWVADVANIVVFADPSNAEARELCARAFEQLGYGTECSTWRNAYLFGAQELRGGVRGAPVRGRSNDIARALTPEMFFDALAVRLNGERAEGLAVEIGWRFSDTGEAFSLTLENCALSHAPGPPAAPDALVTMTRAVFAAVAAGRKTIPEALRDGDAAIEGDGGKIFQLFDLLENFDSAFAIVEP